MSSPPHYPTLEVGSPTKFSSVEPIFAGDEATPISSNTPKILDPSSSHSLATFSILSQAHDLAELKREHPHLYQLMKKSSESLEKDEMFEMDTPEAVSTSSLLPPTLSTVPKDPISLEDYPVKTFNSLKEIYSDPKSQLERYQRISSQFVQLYGKKPDYFSRSPARVNLMGEHLDYSGYPVVNVALDSLDVVIACALVPGGKRWEVANSSVGFDPQNIRKVSLLPEQEGYLEFDPKKKDWLAYFRATLKSCFDVLKIDPWHVKGHQRQESVKSPENLTDSLSHLSLEPRSSTPRPAPSSLTLQMLIDGNIPSQAGLSSSAALCLAVALAVIKAYTPYTVTKRTCLSIAMKAESSLGVYCSGMDHSISLLPLNRGPIANHFSPELWSDPLTLPQESWSIVVSNCGFVPDKTSFAPKSYHVRQLECRLASAVMENEVNLALPSATRPTLRMLQDSYLEREDAEFQGNELSTLDQMEDLIEERWSIMDPEGQKRSRGYTVDDIASELGMTVEDLLETYVGDEKVDLQPDAHGQLRADGKRLQLYKRAKHVFNEASRVYRLLAAASPTTTIDEWYDLVNDSQESCRVLYEISSPEVDELVKLARKNGAYCSRLTGAGWGGCIVSLVPDEQVVSFVEALKKGYYDKKFADKVDDKVWFDKMVIVSKMGIGGGVLPSVALK